LEGQRLHPWLSLLEYCLFNGIKRFISTSTCIAFLLWVLPLGLRKDDERLLSAGRPYLVELLFLLSQHDDRELSVQSADQIMTLNSMMIFKCVILLISLTLGILVFLILKI